MHSQHSTSRTRHSAGRIKKQAEVQSEEPELRTWAYFVLKAFLTASNLSRTGPPKEMTWPLAMEKGDLKYFLGRLPAAFRLVLRAAALLPRPNRTGVARPEKISPQYFANFIPVARFFPECFNMSP